MRKDESLQRHPDRVSYRDQPSMASEMKLTRVLHDVGPSLASHIGPARFLNFSLPAALCRTSSSQFSSFFPGLPLSSDLCHRLSDRAITYARYFNTHERILGKRSWISTLQYCCTSDVEIGIFVSRLGFSVTPCLSS